MTDESNLGDYLVISRGRWDADKSPAEIQRAIDAFYAWHDRLVREGRMRSGSRLSTERRVVSKAGITDGPYSEAKEVIGGYWWIRAASLDEAAALAAQNPCLACGLALEIRPIEEARASAFQVTNETPQRA